MVVDTCISVQRASQVKQQLEKELLLTNLVIDRVTDAVFWVKPNAKFFYVNDAACSLVGYSRKELLCMSIQDLNLEFLIEVWLQHWETIKQQGSLYFTSLYCNQEGLSLPVEITVTYMEEEGKEYGCLLIRKLNNRQQTPFEILASLPPAVAQTAKPSLSIFPANPLLSQIFEFIEANYHQSISLCDVATAIGYSPAYLTNLVRRHTGQPVNHWIIERRMAEARALLIETNQSVHEIAETVGYQNEGHFFRQFRQHHKTTPQVWRKAQREEHLKIVH
ncbi:MAG: helix-turn-helix domain-containing protein [Gloeotrichia echinulata DEX184]|jgi:PAS domain S-box-containing protein|nr:helix-turn-helix domain-containing protein [Gloeotrichia echinulata DEX184]